MSNQSEEYNDNGKFEETPDAGSLSENSYEILKKSQNFALAGSICGAVSVIVGGVLLSTIGLILSIVSFAKFHSVQTQHASNADLLKKIKRMSIIAITICAVALALNFISALVLLPRILEMVSTGDISTMGLFGSYAPSPSPGASVTWG